LNGNCLYELIKEHGGEEHKEEVQSDSSKDSDNKSNGFIIALESKFGSNKSRETSNESADYEPEGCLRKDV